VGPSPPTPCFAEKIPTRPRQPGWVPPGCTKGVHYCRSAGPVMVSLTTGLLLHLPASDPSGRRGAAADGSHLRDLWGYGPVAVVGVPSLRL